jgi:hypothetical protein
VIWVCERRWDATSRAGNRWKATTKHGFGLAIPKGHNALFQDNHRLICACCPPREVRWCGHGSLGFFVPRFCLVHRVAARERRSALITLSTSCLHVRGAPVVATPLVYVFLTSAAKTAVNWTLLFRLPGSLGPAARGKAGCNCHSICCILYCRSSSSSGSRSS